MSSPNGPQGIPKAVQPGVQAKPQPVNLNGQQGAKPAGAKPNDQQKPGNQQGNPQGNGQGNQQGNQQGKPGEPANIKVTSFTPPVVSPPTNIGFTQDKLPIAISKVVGSAAFFAAASINTAIAGNKYTEVSILGGKAPPSLESMIHILLITDTIIFMVLTVIMYSVLSALNRDIGAQYETRMYDIIFDFLVGLVVKALVLYYIASTISSAEYFKYSTNGLNAIAAYRTMIIPIGIVLSMIPYGLMMSAYTTTPAVMDNTLFTLNESIDKVQTDLIQAVDDLSRRSQKAIDLLIKQLKDMADKQAADAKASTQQPAGGQPKPGSPGPSGPNGPSPPVQPNNAPNNLTKPPQQSTVKASAATSPTAPSVPNIKDLTQTYQTAANDLSTYEQTYDATNTNSLPQLNVTDFVRYYDQLSRAKPNDKAAKLNDLVKFRASFNKNAHHKDLIYKRDLAFNAVKSVVNKFKPINGGGLDNIGNDIVNLLENNTNYSSISNNSLGNNTLTSQLQDLDPKSIVDLCDTIVKDIAILYDTKTNALSVKGFTSQEFIVRNALAELVKNTCKFLSDNKTIYGENDNIKNVLSFILTEANIKTFLTSKGITLNNNSMLASVDSKFIEFANMSHLPVNIKALNQALVNALAPTSTDIDNLDKPYNEELVMLDTLLNIKPGTGNADSLSFKVLEKMLASAKVAAVAAAPSAHDTLTTDIDTINATMTGGAPTGNYESLAKAKLDIYETAVTTVTAPPAAHTAVAMEIYGLYIKCKEEVYQSKDLATFLEKFLKPSYVIMTSTFMQKTDISNTTFADIKTLCSNLLQKLEDLNKVPATVTGGSLTDQVDELLKMIYVMDNTSNTNYGQNHVLQNLGEMTGTINFMKQLNINLPGLSCKFDKLVSLNNGFLKLKQKSLIDSISSSQSIQSSPTHISPVVNIDENADLSVRISSMVLLLQNLKSTLQYEKLPLVLKPTEWSYSNIKVSDVTAFLLAKGGRPGAYAAVEASVNKI